MALEKAKFIDERNHYVIEVQFNPSSLSIDTTAMVSEQKTQQLGSDSAIVNIGGIKSRQLRVTLVFDTCPDEQFLGFSFSSKPKSVKNIVVDFEVLMSSSTEISFVWGGIKFTGCVNSISVKYEMFTQNGTPVRATVDIVMEESKLSEEHFETYEWNQDIYIGNMSEEDALAAIAAMFT